MLGGDYRTEDEAYLGVTSGRVIARIVLLGVAAALCACFAVQARGDVFYRDPPLFERRLTPQQRNADLAPDLLDAILRIEGIFDPTRQGMFGPAMRMMVRAGTASMTDVFGDHWKRADADPNLHVRVRYLAHEWLRPSARRCADFRRFRPDELAIALDLPTQQDCARLAQRSFASDSETIAVLTRNPTALPVFAAPYPGSRFTPAELQAIVEEHFRAVKIKAWWTGPLRRSLLKR